ncbi:hydrogenase expression/formation protein HypC [Alteromonadaceae bacterium 2753L.S.0a.02]|nr:hydrogenase expression/formation protein HypC [Alteromonadaceae bacterium 2753L.S.0a.02]
MCLAIPMKICAINDGIANCEAAGVYRDVSLQLIADQKLQSGDFVLVHLGYAIQKVAAQDAAISRAAFDEMQVAEKGEAHA